MPKYFLAGLLWLLLMPCVGAQTHLAGKVVDEHGLPLPGCHVHRKVLCAITNAEGTFYMEWPGHPDRIVLTHIGYLPLDTLVYSGMPLVLQLTPAPRNLQEIAVLGSLVETLTSRQKSVMEQKEIRQRLTGTLMQSLQRIAGVHSIDIGHHASKPLIRGFSSQRVVVSENGLRQEGQQWGADHGLELDAFAMETVEILKGPAAIEFGSDALGGALIVHNHQAPLQAGWSGNTTFFARSVNGGVGTSVQLAHKGKHHFFKGKFTGYDFGDYRVTTDQIEYLERKIPIYHKRLKNSAGQEYDGWMQWGYRNHNYRSLVTTSVVTQKSGFFPGAHGVPDPSRLEHDGHSRNVEFPFQKAVHFKAMQQNQWQLPHAELQIDWGYQRNVREEHSPFHTHYANQPLPLHNPNLELKFNLDVWQANLKMASEWKENFKWSAGIQTQWKNNAVGGYGYLLPEYQSFSAGAFAKTDYSLTPTLVWSMAVRADFNQLQTIGYFDPILFAYLTQNGLSETEADKYAQRSSSQRRRTASWSGLTGIRWTPNSLMDIRANLGKAFRTPTAVELASNGIHHGSFRHEMGNPNLRNESGYYADLSVAIQHNGWKWEIAPYAYWFGNYLFLNPTGAWSVLPHAGQIYRYEEARAWLGGVEISMDKNWKRWDAHLQFEYLYSRQQTNGKSFPLPFMPPVNGLAEVGYRAPDWSTAATQNRIFIQSRMAASQNRIARNEKVTPGYVVWSAGCTTQIKTNGHTSISVTLQGNNLFNTKYLNHMSFYRKLEIPEQARNIQIMCQFTF